MLQGKQVSGENFLFFPINMVDCVSYMTFNSK
jgi:hypothetical protein